MAPDAAAASKVCKKKKEKERAGVHMVGGGDPTTPGF
jgi:hypothetical protein